MSLKHGLVIVSDWQFFQLHVYMLHDGSFVRSIGNHGSGRGQFNFLCGGLCITPDNDGVLVAECYNRRVQEVRIMGDKSPWVRFIGVDGPQYVDCNSKAIVTSGDEAMPINVFSWVTGERSASFGGPGQDLHRVRLLANGDGLVVADTSRYRLCVFGLTGELVRAMALGVSGPYDFLPMDDGFVVINLVGNLATVSADGGGVAWVELGRGCARALTALPDGGFVTRTITGLHVFHGLALRASWIALCCTQQPQHYSKFVR